LVKSVSKRAGVKFHLHQFRHTFAVNFLKSTNNIAHLMQLLGHKDIRMTMTYLRCLPTEGMRGGIESLTIEDFV
jgi:integrase